MEKCFYLTTAIDYVNGAPHLGHAYEKVITDVIARARRSLGQPVFLLTGLDEHGQKVQQAAAAEGKSPQEYCDGLAVQWRELTRTLHLTNSDFIRTTEKRHYAVVQSILSRLHRQGDLYKAEYRGWYSARQESFLTDKDRGPDGKFDPMYGEVTELVEQNWYFRMGRHQAWLIDHIEKNPDFIRPDYRRNEVLGFLRTETLEDLCISRPVARLNWGIPLPFDPEYVTYVWFDALTNYLTVPVDHGDPGAKEWVPEISPRPGSAGIRLWPADIHVIGKDILKFHAVYWPIMLKAMNAPLPGQLLAHGWWQKDGQKISKSTGNVVDPVATIQEWGVDAFRYYVVRELDIGADGNWTDTGFAQRYTSELANGLGNLVNRSLSMLKKYRNGVLSGTSRELEPDAMSVVAEVEKHLGNNQLQAALQAIWRLVNRGNEFVAQTEPYRLAKDPAKAGRLDEVLYSLVETCRILAVLLWPFIPSSSEKIYAQLKVCGEVDKWTATRWGALEVGHEVGDPQPLFPRRDVPA